MYISDYSEQSECTNFNFMLHQYLTDSFGDNEEPAANPAPVSEDAGSKKTSASHKSPKQAGQLEPTEPAEPSEQAVPNAIRRPIRATSTLAVKNHDKEDTEMQKTTYVTVWQNYGLLNFIHCICRSDYKNFYYSNEIEAVNIRAYVKKYKSDSNFRSADKLFTNIICRRRMNDLPVYIHADNGNSKQAAAFSHSANNGTSANGGFLNDVSTFELKALECLIGNFDFLDYIHSIPSRGGVITPRSKDERKSFIEFSNLIKNNPVFGYANIVFTAGLGLRGIKFEFNTEPRKRLRASTELGTLDKSRTNPDGPAMNRRAKGKRQSSK